MLASLELKLTSAFAVPSTVGYFRTNGQISNTRMNEHSQQTVNLMTKLAGEPVLAEPLSCVLTLNWSAFGPLKLTAPDNEQGNKHRENQHSAPHRTDEQQHQQSSKTQTAASDESQMFALSRAVAYQV